MYLYSAVTYKVLSTYNGALFCCSVFFLCCLFEFFIAIHFRLSTAVVSGDISDSVYFLIKSKSYLVLQTMLYLYCKTHH